LTRSQGPWNPAARAADTTSRGVLGGHFGKIPLISDQGNYGETDFNAVGGAYGALRLGPIALGAYTYGETQGQKGNNISSIIYEQVTAQFAGTAGYRINEKWSLGADFRYLELSHGFQDDSSSRSISQHVYNSASLYVHMQKEDLQGTLRLVPYQARTKSEWLLPEKSWTGPLGIEADVATLRPFLGRASRMGVRGNLEIPLADEDNLIYEATPYVCLNMGTQSNVQGSLSFGTIDGDQVFKLSLGGEIGITRSLYAQAQAQAEQTRFLLANEANTRLIVQLGLGWSFRAD
jgi:hypothetical protein